MALSSKIQGLHGTVITVFRGGLSGFANKINDMKNTCPCHTTMLSCGLRHGHGLLAERMFSGGAVPLYPSLSLRLFNDYRKE